MSFYPDQSPQCTGMLFSGSEDPYFSYEDGYFNPEEENERVMIRMETSNNTQNTKSYQELESHEGRPENVDARLHRMLLQKDLPLKSVLLSSREESSSIIQNIDYYTEGGSRQESSENLDKWLPKMMLEEASPVKLVCPPGSEYFTNSLEIKSDVDEEPCEQRSENLDARLKRMMLQEDLPLFLQEFEEVWQDARIKKFGSQENSIGTEFNTGEEKVNLSTPVAVVVRKDLKRLRKRNFDMNTNTLKKIRNKITDKVKGQVKEDIMELLLTEKIEAWFQSHENEVKL